MEAMKRVLSFVRRAIDDYQMIKPGDKIAVGVSAGKDSLTIRFDGFDGKRAYPGFADASLCYGGAEALLSGAL